MEQTTAHDAANSPTAPMWQRPSALEVSIASLIPIVGVIWLGWNGFTLLLLYWVESAVAGAVNVLRMLLARPYYKNMAEQILADRWMLKRYPISDAEWQLAQETPARTTRPINSCSCPFSWGTTRCFLPHRACCWCG
ncbi:MAG: DUF6498-containing protein [Pirellulales bacterium]